MNNDEFQEQAAKVDQSVEQVNAIVDETARAIALDLMQSLMDLHGTAIARMVELLNSSDAGRTALEKLGSDPLVCGLLVLYGVHPSSLEERVKTAIERLGLQLQKQSASAEFIGINDAVVRVKIESTGQGRGASVDSIRQTVEEAIRELAPEVVEVIAESIATPPDFVPLSTIKPAAREKSDYEESAA